MKNVKPVIALAGPTASGKTKLSVLMAQRFDAEIISADSMQIYQYMDIGTAKVMPNEMLGVPHYMIDEFTPDINVNISLFCEHAVSYINDILSRQKTVLTIGGSGLYLDSLLYASYDYSNGESDEEYKKELYKILDDKGKDYLYEMLEKTDSKYAAITHPNNIKRVIRALEYHHVTGKPKSENIKEKIFRYENTFYFALKQDREALYSRINARVDTMIKDGLIDEVRGLMKKGYTVSLNSMKAIGYKEIIDSLNGKMSMEEAIELIKQNSRNYAKRQMTWFNANKDIVWIVPEQYQNNDKIIDFMENVINANRKYI